ncbi:MAG: DNA cytosine methyltransferase [Chloroflexi bacterium]|nr:DNA cytosine methyltransferase [Chloroflexota bacterium]
MNSIELFAGAGGLAIGSAKAGFRHTVVMDWDHNACETIRKNKKARLRHVRDWEVVEGDVRGYDFRQHQGTVDFVLGGPPCQPFSLGGKHRGNEDVRNMFPEAVRAVREICPRAFVFENVKGLLRRSFSNYFHYILNQLRFPTVARRGDEEWTDHQARLESVYAGNSFSGLHYKVMPKLLNAADYGVPQRRERVFMVGVRSDIHAEFSFPEPTHEEDALLFEKWVTGEYWEQHGVPMAKREKMPDRLRGRVEALGLLTKPMLLKRWQTVRDAIHDLPIISVGEISDKVRDHYLNPGAKSYQGHNGSPLDEPAKTLKAGDHGVPGGENTLRLPDGSIRYFSVRECARVQTFPDNWAFEGSWTECMRQLGNAVPVTLGQVVARRLAAVMVAAEVKGRLVKKASGGCSVRRS